MTDDRWGTPNTAIPWGSLSSSFKVHPHSGRHMSAEEVFKEVQARTRAINVATVYRTLELLVEEGLVSRPSSLCLLIVTS